MDTTTIPDYPRGVTFEQVWAALMEGRGQLREIAERQKENDEWMKRFERSMEKSKQEWDKQFGDLSNRFGKMAEHLVRPGIYKRFNELGYHFSEEGPGGLKIRDKDGNIRTEIDLLLQNDDTVMVVEIKVTPRVKDIGEHIKRLEILRDVRHRKNDLRKIEGAIAGAIFGAVEKKAVIEAGLYVIEQSGDTMRIDVPEGFVPRRW